MKAYILKGYKNWPEFMDEIKNDPPEIQTAKLNDKVEDFLSKKQNERLFDYYV